MSLKDRSTFRFNAPSGERQADHSNNAPGERLSLSGPQPCARQVTAAVKGSRRHRWWLPPAFPDCWPSPHAPGHPETPPPPKAEGWRWHTGPWQWHPFSLLTFRESGRQQDILPFLALGIDRIEDHCDSLFKAQIQDSAVSGEGSLI